MKSSSEILKKKNFEMEPPIKYMCRILYKQKESLHGLLGGRSSWSSNDEFEMGNFLSTSHDRSLISCLYYPVQQIMIIFLGISGDNYLSNLNVLPD